MPIILIYIYIYIYTYHPLRSSRMWQVYNFTIHYLAYSLFIFFFYFYFYFYFFILFFFCYWQSSGRLAEIRWYNYSCPLSKAWGPFQVTNCNWHHRHFHVPLFVCSIVFLVLEQIPSSCISFRFLLLSLPGPSERQNSLDGKFSLWLLLISLYR